MNDHPPFSLLDPDLVTTLIQMFALGYIDRMAGFHVTENDVIAGVDARDIELKALDCIDQREDDIHSDYYENPQAIHDAIYEAGRSAYAEQERQYLQWK